MKLGALVVFAVDTLLSLGPAAPCCATQAGGHWACPPFPFPAPLSRSAGAGQPQESWSSGQSPEALGKGNCFSDWPGYLRI